MALSFDFHTHSTASDGTLTPAELVEAAHRAGIRHLALTDHDTVAGISEARAHAAGLGLNLVPGVEISVSWYGRTIHVLGLGVDPENARLQAGLARLQDYRRWRAGEIARRLEKAGIPGALEGAMALAVGDQVGRTHFARFLVQAGHAPDMKRVFKRFLVSGRPGHVPGEWIYLEQAVEWIHGAGGVAVIAHPARYRFTRTRLRLLLEEFRELGGEGLEVVSGSHSPDDYRTMARHAADFDLLASAGSDYHGPENPWIELGRLPELPAGCRPVWACLQESFDGAILSDPS